VRPAALLLVLALLVGACGSRSAPTSAPPAPTGTNGALQSNPTDLPLLPALQGLAQRAVKVRYKSTSGIDGSATTVSGIVLVPKGQPPEGGWRIASLGHPTAGMDSTCAPSSYPGLMGNAGTIAAYLTYGYVVAMTDYQGLGTAGPHPYLEPKTAAYNVIDAVRAAKALVPQASSQWVSYGVSQGGQAVWEANEIAPDYGTDLDLVGTIAVSPPADLRPMVDAMQNDSLTLEQKALLPAILRGVQIAHPDVHLEDYLHGTMLTRLDSFLGCEGENSELRTLIVQSAPDGDFQPSSPQAADRLRQIFGDIALPARQASAPMMVAYGDADQTVLPEWTAAAIARACQLGDAIETVVVPGGAHGVLNLGSRPVEFTQARFAGLPPNNTCPPA
jgi:hypothetical protein